MGASLGPLELPDAAVIDAVNAERVQALCCSELATDEAWCVLYCGAVAKVRESLMTVCHKSKFHYAEESFDW